MDTQLVKGIEAVRELIDNSDGVVIDHELVEWGELQVTGKYEWLKEFNLAEYSIGIDKKRIEWSNVREDICRDFLKYVDKELNTEILRMQGTERMQAVVNLNGLLAKLSKYMYEYSKP